MYASCMKCLNLTAVGARNCIDAMPQFENYTCNECNECKEHTTIENKFKKCPNCSVFTERTGGCNHITCTQCNTHWCWSCGKDNDDNYGGKFTDVSIYDHMSNCTGIFPNHVDGNDHGHGHDYGGGGGGGAGIGGGGAGIGGGGIYDDDDDDY